MLASVSILTSPSPFVRISYFLISQDIPGASCIFPAAALQSFPKSPDFCQLGSGI